MQVKDLHCPFCKSEIDRIKSETVVKCVSCKTIQHTKCWNDYGGCSVFGCGGTLTREEQQRQRRVKFRILAFVSGLIVLSTLAIIFMKNGGLLLGSIVGFTLSNLFWNAYRDPEQNKTTREIWNYYQNSVIILLHACGFFLVAIFALVWLLFSQ